VGCREATDKRELIRLVRSPDGSVHVDRTGTAPGRGAYVHARPSCGDAALQRGALARALRAVVTPEEASTLRAEIEGAGTT
jgi:uncharacterized protein